MNQPRSTTETPPGGIEQATRTDEVGPRGIEWVNLMMISEHAQADYMGRLSGKPARWIFRIELDTEFSNPNDGERMRRLLKDGDFDGARRHLLSVRKTNDPASVLAVIDGAFRDLPIAPSSAPVFSPKGEVVVHVIEDFGNGAAHKEIARAQLDVPLHNTNLAELRDHASNDPQHAKSTLRPLVGKERGERVVDATFD
ncbi:MAG TPA: hypothetical protein VJ802_01755 [Gemmatimonadaceae bacterium]|nr:hypothetical protein [Gemmatimonadaceae bacterium]